MYYTGIKFILLTHPAYASAQASLALQRVYEVYADHAMKNPFYTVGVCVCTVCVNLSMHKYVRHIMTHDIYYDIYHDTRRVHVYLA